MTEKFVLVSLADPQRRPPQEGEARTSTYPNTTGPAPLNEGLPRKGRRGSQGLGDQGERHPSTKASPGRGGEPLGTYRRSTV